MNKAKNISKCPVPKTSLQAIASLVLGLLSVAILPAIPAVILGVLAWRKISRSNGRLRGKGLAVTGICTAILLLFVGILLPAILAARKSVRHSYSLRNVKQIVFSMHGYEEANGTFPVAGVDENGVGPKLSWRVHVLPYIKHKELYKRFHLDESWDSPHNKELIQYMPKLYNSPVAELGQGKTVYLAVTGPGTMFQGGETGESFAGFNNNEASETMVLVEASIDQAVEWTKPSDWQFDPNYPKQGVGNLCNSRFLYMFDDYMFDGDYVGFLAAFADGHAVFVSADDDEIIKAMVARVVKKIAND